MITNTMNKFIIPLKWQAAIWNVLSCMCFAGINGIVRYLTGGSPIANEEPLPVYVIMFFQNAFGSLFMLPLLLQTGISDLRSSYQSLHLLRVAMAIGGIGVWYLSLYYMPITQGIALSFTGPIMTVIAAKFILDESIDLRRGTALLVCFIGAFIVMRPDLSLFGNASDSIGWYALLPLLSAALISGTKILARKLAGYGESAKTLTTYLLVLMTPVSLIPALFTWVTPSLWHWKWLLLMGLLASGAHYSFSKCCTSAEIVFTTPFGFSKILLGAAVGFFAFGEFTSAWTVWIGAAILFSSTIILAYPSKEKLRSV